MPVLQSISPDSKEYRRIVEGEVIGFIATSPLAFTIPGRKSRLRLQNAPMNWAGMTMRHEFSRHSGSEEPCRGTIRK
jgi:hypothetical protein